MLTGKSDFTKVMQTIRNGKVLPTPGTTIDRREHAILRKPFTRAFAMASPTKYEPFVDETICRMVRRLDQEFISGPQGRKRCETDKWLQYCNRELHSYRIATNDNEQSASMLWVRCALAGHLDFWILPTMLKASSLLLSILFNTLQW